MSDDIIARPAESIRVQTAAELQAALETATGGETIVLAEGDYGHVNIEAMAFDTDVTLVSEAPQAARMTGFIVHDVSNLVVEGMFFDYVGEPAGSKKVNRSEFRVNHSENVTIRDSLFEGAEMDRPGNSGHELPTGTGLRVYKSEGVLIEDNEIRTFWKGMKVAESDDTIVRGNEFHDLRSDGLNTTRSQDLLVEGNHFHDFRGNPETGDHMDFIQMYTTADGPIPRNIVFKDNYLDMGEGSSAQGIFLQHPGWAEKARGEDLFYENVVITGNVVISGSPNGIILNKTHGAVVTNNVLLEARDDDSPAPRIGIQGRSTDVTLTGNVTHSIPGSNDDGTWGAEKDWTVADNLVLSGREDFEDIFINGTDVTGVRDTLAFRPDGPADGVTVGAPALAYDPAPEKLAAMIQPDRGEIKNTFTFDGTYSAGPEGPASGAGAQFHWDFGDGTTATGPEASHRYKTAGVFTTTLTVTLPDGRSDTSTATVDIQGPDFLSYDAATGALLHHAAGEEVALDPGAADDPADGPGGPLAFDWKTMIRLPDGLTDMLAGAESMTFAAHLRAEKFGMIFNAKAQHSVEITEDGELALNIKTADGVHTQRKTDGAGLLDNAWHDISVTFDGAADMVLMTVDGQQWSFSAPMEAYPDSLGEQLKLGAPRGRGGSFTGEIDMLDIDIDGARYDFAAAPAPAPVTDTPAEPSVTAPDDPVPETDDGPAAAVGIEAGSVTVAQAGPDQWHAVRFSAAIEDARVVMGPVSGAGSDPAFARVRNVTETGFEFQIDEWDYLDGAHVAETIAWIAGSAGTHSLTDGRTVSFGRTTLTDDTAGRVDLEGFDATPAVFAQVTSAADDAAVVLRPDALSATGFRLRMQEEEAADQRHATETADWLALEHGIGGGLDTFVFGDRIGENADTISFDAEADVVLAGMQAERGSDTAAVRFADLRPGAVDVRVEEEQSRDNEITHRATDIAVLAAMDGMIDLVS